MLIPRIQTQSGFVKVSSARNMKRGISFSALLKIHQYFTNTKHTWVKVDKHKSVFTRRLLEMESSGDSLL